MTSHLIVPTSTREGTRWSPEIYNSFSPSQKIEDNEAGPSTLLPGHDSEEFASSPVKNEDTTLDTFQAWLAAYVELKRQDEQMHKEYREEIDTLLVFAGLFSAVLTAFVIESYQALRSEAPPTSSSLRINIFWFLSLVLSLVSALFGFLLKGWTREYMRWTDTSPPQDAVGLRQFRYEGLQQWQLPLVLASLPGLLQTALVLFFCGLFDFMWHLNTFVATIVGSVTFIFLALAISTAIFPAFSRSSPFKSPLSRMVLRSRFLIASATLKTYLALSRLAHAPSLRITRWLLQSVEYWRHNTWEELDSRGVKTQDAMSAHHTGCDARIRGVHHLYSKINDDDLFERVRPCLYDTDVHGARILPMLNCWPIASAMLKFEDSRHFARAIRQLEIPSSRAYNNGQAMTVRLSQNSLSTLGFSIYDRVGAMPRRMKHLLTSLILEATSFEQGATKRDVLLNVLYLLPAFVAEDSVLIRQYILMLAPLAAGAAPPDIQVLASTHLQIAAAHLDHDEAEWERSEIHDLLQLAVHVHRRSPQDRDLFSLLWDISISAAASANFDVHDLVSRAYVMRLLWAIEEDLSNTVIRRGYRPWVLNFRCWKSLGRLARKDRNMLPGPLVEDLSLCIGVKPERTKTDPADALLHAMDVYTSLYVM